MCMCVVCICVCVCKICNLNPLLNVRTSVRLIILAALLRIDEFVRAMLPSHLPTLLHIVLSPTASRLYANLQFDAVGKSNLKMKFIFTLAGPSRRPRGLRRRSAAACLLGWWVRILPGAWMFVCCECCVLSGRGLCDEMIIRPEESYRLWFVVVCDLENLMNEEPYPINVIELNIGDTSLDVFPTCR